MAQSIKLLKTERLILRGIDEGDAEAIVKWRSDPDVYRYFKNPHAITLDEHLKWFHKSYLQNEDRFDWMCIERSTGDRVGVFGLSRDKQTAEINYILAPEFQHKGYASEGILTLVEYAREKWKLKEIIAEIHKNNIASINFIERMGFRQKRQQSEFLIYCKEV